MIDVFIFYYNCSSFHVQIHPSSGSTLHCEPPPLKAPGPPERKAVNKDTTTPVSSLTVTQSTPPNKKGINVVYVQKQNAKQLKTELEKCSLLDKRYRMGPASSSSSTDLIAVPILEAGLIMLQNAAASQRTTTSWMSLVAETGQQESMPLSTAQYARKSKKKK